MNPVAIAVTVVLSAGVGVVVKRWLDSRAYRYDEEAETRLRSHAWVLIGMPLAVTAVAVGQYATGGAALAVASAIITAVLVTVSAIDLDVRRLPDIFTGPLALGTALALALVAAIAGEWHPFTQALFGGLALAAAYLLLVAIGEVVSDGGMGLGDLKLAPTLGMLLGWHSWTHVLAGTMAAFFIGGLTGIALMIFAGRGRKSTIPFGPFMVIGCLAILAAPAAARF